MSLLAEFRHRKARARRLLAVLAVLWLNIVLQPCVMALGTADEHRCPHCPPAHKTQMHSEHGHAGMQVCADSGPECGGFEQASQDTRIGEVKVKPSPELVYFVPAWPEHSIASSVASDRSSNWRMLSMLPGEPPPLNILNCVYLN